jgi:hypothetical protein
MSTTVGYLLYFFDACSALLEVQDLSSNLLPLVHAIGKFWIARMTKFPIELDLGIVAVSSIIKSLWDRIQIWRTKRVNFPIVSFQDLSPTMFSKS